jgi:hypothetical protein
MSGEEYRIAAARAGIMAGDMTRILVGFALVTGVVLAACGGDDAATADGGVQDSAFMTVFDAYAAAWREPDAGRRLVYLMMATTDNVVVIEGDQTVTGRSELAAQIDAFLQANPGGSRSVTGAIAQMHARAWHTWAARDRNGADVLTGVAWLRLAGDGRIERLYAFTGALPATPAPPAALAAFVDAQNEADETMRDAALITAVTDEVLYIDRDGVQVGRDALSILLGARLGASPTRTWSLSAGHLAVPTGLYTRWQSASPDRAGMLFLRLAADNRLAEISLFTE